jgi:trk system potassium uptake protein TrkA
MSKQIAVIGLGRFGFHAARELQAAGNDVLAIDIEHSNVQRIKDLVSRAVCLDARDKERLRALGVADFDVVVISLGERIDASTLVALHMKELKVPKIVTKAGSADHGKLLALIGVHEIVYPEQEAAERLARRIAKGNLIDFIPLGETHSIQEIAPPDGWIGKTLEELALPSRYGVQVIGARDAIRDDVVLNPGAGFRVKESDALVILGENDDLETMKPK